MEYWSIGVMEYWLSRTVCGIAFLNHQMIRPFSSLSLFLQSLHKLQQTVLKFECEGIERFKILGRDLVSVFVRIEP